MNIRITQRNIVVGKYIKEYVQEKFSKMSKKYVVRITDIAIVLEEKKHSFLSEVRVQAKNIKIIGKGEATENILSAIESAAHKVETQLKKHKDKVKRKKGSREVVEDENVVFDDEQEYDE